jgi:bacteriocin-associated integral membrane protein
MKKVLNILLALLLSAFAFAIAYVNTDDAEREQMKALSTITGEAFVIPDDAGLADPEKAYNALLRAATDAQVNIVRTNAGYGPDDVPELTQYVLLTTNTRVFESFALKHGRWLTPSETQSGQHYLSTATSADLNHVGTLRDFGGDDRVAVRPLTSAYESLPVTGRYFAESSSAQSLKQFFELLAHEAGQPYSVADFKVSGGITSGGISLAASQYLNVMLYFIVLLTTVLLVYSLLHEAKQVGVMKLHGLGTVHIWYKVSGRITMITMAAAIAASLAGAWLVEDSTVAFLGSVLTGLGRAYVIMLAASLTTCLYITRIRLSDTIKNRKDTRGVFALNTVMKAGSSVVIVAVATWGWLQYSDIADQRSALGNWEKTKNYATFTPTNVGNDLTALETGQPGPTTAEVYELYPLLNSRGALYVDASAFNKNNLTHVQGAPPPSMQVNPNFLHAYPVRGASGQIIDVPETVSDWIVLAPETYKANEGEMVSYFQDLRKGARLAERKCSGREPPSSLADQRVRIIWTASGQRVFSFDPNVFPDANNEIRDPIIQVMTTANSVGCDRANTASGAIDGAMKVRLANGDPKATFDSLRPELSRMKLDDNLKHLVTVNDHILQKIQQIQEAVRQAAMVAGGLLVVLLVLAAESLALGFTMYARRIVVRRLHGASVVRAYREYLLILGSTWTFQFVAVLLLLFAFQILGVFTSLNASVGTVVPVATAITAATIGVELLFSNTAIALIERRNLIKVLKGEF